MAAEVVADLEAGVLRLSRPALRLLAAVAGEQQAPPEAEPGLFDALQEAGLVTPAGLHPSVAPLAAAVARPVVHVRFDHLGPGTPVECPGWIDPHVAVLAVPDEEGLHDILAVPTSFFPARLAALVGLGPRPRPPVSGSLRLDTGVLEGLLSGLVSGVDDVRRHVGPALPQAAAEALVTLGGRRRAHWRVTTWWGEPPATRRSHEVIDAPAVGFWLVERIGGDVEVRPVTPTRLWRLLIGLLPGDDEL